MILELKRQVEQYQNSIQKFLYILRASGNYRTRQGIKMTDLELEEFIQIMTYEMMLLPVEAFMAKDFLEKVESNFPRWLKWLRKKRGVKTLPDQWVIYRSRVRDLIDRSKDGRIYLRKEENDATGPIGAAKAI